MDCPTCKLPMNFTNNCPKYNRVWAECEININHVHYFCCGNRIVVADNITKEPRTAAGSLD